MQRAIDGDSIAALTAARSDDGPATRHPPAVVPSDADLVRAAQSETAAFAPLYERYFEPIYRYCLRRTGDHHQAEDATAIIFSRALQGIGGCRQPGRFRAWLFTIAHHQMTDRYRRPAPAIPLDPASHDLRDPARLPEDQVIAAEERARLRAAMVTLPDDQRTVIDLKLAGLTPRLCPAPGCSDPERRRTSRDERPCLTIR